MKLVRFSSQGSIHWGILGDSSIETVSFPELHKTGQTFLISQVQMLVPADPSKIICVGRNYAAHAAELGNTVLSEPGLFLKAPNTLALHGCTIAYPTWTESLHFEGELGLVIKSKAYQVAPENALQHVLGYTCAVDLTARDKQKSDLQWFRAKSANHFLPFGPHLETNLEPHNSHIITKINGETRQDAPTNLMIYDVPFVISYVSQFMTLEPGDVIITGTPEGVGALNVGDHIELSIAGVGMLEVWIGAKP